MSEFVFISEKNRERYLRLIRPVGGLFSRMKIHPNVVSMAGLLLSAAAGAIYSTGRFFWAAWVVVLAGTCDALDGLLARQTQKTSKFGAFFDSSLDRYGESFLFLGLAWHFSGGRIFFVNPQSQTDFQSPLAVLLIVLAVAGSFMVSYTRARAEGIGVECTVGWMQRPERITLLIIGSLAASIPVVGHTLMIATLLILAILSNITAVHRILHVRKQIIQEHQSS